MPLALLPALGTLLFPLGCLVQLWCEDFCFVLLHLFYCFVAFGCGLLGLGWEEKGRGNCLGCIV